MADSSVHVDIKNLKEFRKALKALGPEWSKKLRAAHKEVANEARQDAVSEAEQLGGQAAAASDTIKARGTTGSARLSVRATAGVPFALPAFWGNNKRTGWNASNSGSAPQFPEWVGNSWSTGSIGEGPRALNDAIGKNIDRYESRLQELLDDISREAFPD